MPIFGIDVSRLQGEFDWKEEAARGTRFAYVKATQGNEMGADSHFANNVYAAAHAGIAVGAYHFCYPLGPAARKIGRDARSQCVKFFEACRYLPLTLPPAIDLEWPAPEDWGRWGVDAISVARWGLEMASECLLTFGRKPVIYTYPYFWNAVKADPFLLSQYAPFPLWLADYNANHIAPTEPPWDRATIIQRTGGGYVLPNGARSDRNEFMGSEEEFRAFCTF